MNNKTEESIMEKGLNYFENICGQIEKYENSLSATSHIIKSITQSQESSADNNEQEVLAFNTEISESLGNFFDSILEKIKNIDSIQKSSKSMLNFGLKKKGELFSEKSGLADLTLKYSDSIESVEVKKN